MSAPYVRRAVNWLLSVQQEDGGWGERADTYDFPSRKGMGPSTPSQTAWAVMGLLAAGEGDGPAVRCGITYLVQQQRYDEARTYYREALAFAGEVGDRASVGTTHTHLGHCALLQERFADAQHEFTMALNALEETRFWNGLARVYEYLADMNLRLANYDEAERCADKRIDLARQHANTRMEAAAWEQKAELLQRVGRAEEAADCRARGEAIGAHPPAGN
jgi:tetratricopeptide (TPR) repeat protein